MSDHQLPSTSDILAATTFLSGPDSAHTVAKLNDKLVAKHGSQVTLVEAETMQFVAEHTDVPLPQVHGTSMDPVTQQNFIIMDFVPGQTLERLLPSLTGEEKDDIARLIKNALVKLRNIPEPGYIGSVGRKACAHGMLWGPDGPTPMMSGPFEDEAAFNEGLLLKLATMPHMDPLYVKFLRRLFSEAFNGHRTVLTHGDLQPKNIMVQRTGSREDGSGSFDISFIDWETSGWYPEYWEYCHSLVMGRFKPDWLEMVEKILPVYGFEYTLIQMVFHILYY